MRPRRGPLSGPSQRNVSRNWHRNVVIFCTIVIFSVLGPSLFLTGRTGGLSTRPEYLAEDSTETFQREESRRRSALEQIEELFPKEVRDIINAKDEESGLLNLNIAGRNDLSSSWVREDAVDVSRGNSDSQQELNAVLDKTKYEVSNRTESPEGKNNDVERMDSEKEANEEREIVGTLPVNKETESKLKGLKVSETQTGENLSEVDDSSDGDLGGPKLEGTENEFTGTTVVSNNLGVPCVQQTDGMRQQVTHSKDDAAAKIVRKQLRLLRHEKRLTALIQQDEEQSKKLEAEAIERAKEVEGGVIGTYTLWRPEWESGNQDSMVRLMRDQLIMARAYVNIAGNHNNSRLVRDFKFRIKENMKVLEDATMDAELPKGYEEKMKAMGRLLSKAKDHRYDASAMVKKLRAMLQTSEDLARTYKKQSNFLSQLAAKTVPKGLHCLSMRLTVDYYELPPDERDFPNKEKLEDLSLYHYALFSDNILAAAVVVNSTITNAKEPDKHVFHVVTDTMNFGAMKMWFLDNHPGKGTIQVQNVDKFKWLNSSYSPVLQQLESATMKAYFFKSDKEKNNANLKYRNPKYLSMLNHLRFYLPEVFPKLEKILFLDDDVVVKKDLTPLWAVNLRGKVNGAVETCGPSFHRFDKYLNFSNHHIARNFNPRSCGWAYGMNIFDLEEWKKRDITGIYHRWQTMNEDRTLWKLGTLPPGLITFYNLTHPLEKSWHVLGLGYNPAIEKSEIEGAAVVHYNGNMKPWLEIGMSKFKPYWAKYVKFDHPWLQQCNINE